MDRIIPIAKDHPDFDAESVYDEQIKPLMDRIIAICQQNNIPMLATFCYAKSGHDSAFCTTSVPSFKSGEPGKGWQPARMVRAAHVIYRDTDPLLAAPKGTVQ